MVVTCPNITVLSVDIDHLYVSPTKNCVCISVLLLIYFNFYFLIRIAITNNSTQFIRHNTR